VPVCGGVCGKALLCKEACYKNKETCYREKERPAVERFRERYVMSVCLC
jgi:hypothetical protein